MASRFDRWEYHIDTDGARDDVARLNALGNEGWELVTSLPEGHLIFKRPAPDLRERITRDQRAAVHEARKSAGCT
jgi:hypothetical protein